MEGITLNKGVERKAYLQISPLPTTHTPGLSYLKRAFKVVTSTLHNNLGMPVSQKVNSVKLISEAAVLRLVLETIWKKNAGILSKSERNQECIWWEGQQCLVKSGSCLKLFGWNHCKYWYIRHSYLKYKYYHVWCLYYSSQINDRKVILLFYIVSF